MPSRGREDSDASTRCLAGEVAQLRRQVALESVRTPWSKAGHQRQYKILQKLRGTYVTDLTKVLERVFGSTEDIPVDINTVCAAGEKLVADREKHLRMADNSSWLAVDKYITDPLTENESDEKRWKKAKKEAEDEMEKKRLARDKLPGGRGQYGGRSARNGGYGSGFRAGSGASYDSYRAGGYGGGGYGGGGAGSYGGSQGGGYGGGGGYGAGRGGGGGQGYGGYSSQGASGRGAGGNRYECVLGVAIEAFGAHAHDEVLDGGVGGVKPDTSVAGPHSCATGAGRRATGGRTAGPEVAPEVAPLVAETGELAREPGAPGGPGGLRDSWR